QTVETIRVGDAYRFLGAGGVDHEQLEVLEPEFVRRENNVRAGRMFVRRPAHRSEIGQLSDVRSVQLHGEDVGDQSALVEAPPDDARAIVIEEWPTVVAGNAGQ